MKKTVSTTGVKVPFFDASAEYRFFKKKLHQALREVGEAGVWLLGKQTEKLEQKLAQLTQTNYAIGCASGTDAITLSLLSLGIKSGDRVIVPANAYPSVFGIVAAGAKPVLIDINPETGHVDTDNLSLLPKRGVKAILAVHFWGQAAPLAQILAWAEKNGVALIEDCAQALGATYRNQPVGSFGDLGILSFYPTKHIGALGDAGAVVTNKKRLDQKVRMARMYGEKKRYQSEFLGRNSRIDELQAAFLLKKLPFLPKFLQKRRQLAGIYLTELSGLDQVGLPKESKERPQTYHLFVIRTQRRDKLQEWLKKQGIQTGIHYPKTIQQTPAFQSLPGRFPGAQTWSQETLSLPLHPFLTKTQVKFVAQKIKEFFS